MENINGNQGSQQPDEFAELDNLLQEGGAPSSGDGNQGGGAAGDGQQQPNWEKRAQSAEKFLKDLKDATGAKSVKEIRDRVTGSKPAPAPSGNQAGAGQTSAAAEEPAISVVDMLELRKQKFSDEEILDAHAQSKELGVPMSKLLKNPTFLAGLERQREKAKVANATPAPSQGVAPTFEGGKKTFKELTPKERKANWGPAIDKVRGGGKSSSE